MENYKRIDLFDLLLIISRKIWLFIILIIGMATLAAYASENWIVPVYEAESVLFIGKSKTNIPLSLNDFDLDSKLLMDYVQLINTRLITKEVIKDFNLDISIEDLREKISIGTLEESRFITVNYQDTSPERAVAITNYLANTLTEKAGELLGIENLVIIDYAVIPVDPIFPIVQLNIAVGALIGGILSFIIVLFSYRFDRRIKHRNDLENIGIAVIGFIPRHFMDKEQHV